MKNIIIAVTALFIMTIAATKIEAQTNLKIGDPYKGGIVAYLLKPGDCGYVANQQHGLLASNEDMQAGGQTQFPWCMGTGITCATNNILYGGIQNTGLILSFCPDPGLTAARVCYTYTTPELPVGWYLPDAAELQLLYDNLYKAGIGNFKTNPYWSSNESSATQARQLNFYTGTWYNQTPKSNKSRVRAVHAF